MHHQRSEPLARGEMPERVEAEKQRGHVEEERSAKATNDQLSGSESSVVAGGGDAPAAAFLRTTTSTTSTSPAGNKNTSNEVEVDPHEDHHGNNNDPFPNKDAIADLNDTLYKNQNEEHSETEETLTILDFVRGRSHSFSTFQDSSGGDLESQEVVPTASGKQQQPRRWRLIVALALACVMLLVGIGLVVVTSAARNNARGDNVEWSSKEQEARMWWAPTSWDASAPPPSPAAATGTSAAPPTPSSFVDQARDVIIIGSGWAGLAALDSLVEAGLNVRVLEARDYVGGRTHTDRTSIPGMPVEVGAEWVYLDTSVQSMLEASGLSYGYTESPSDGNVGMYESRAFWSPGQMNAELSQDEMDTLLEKDWTGEDGFLQFAADKSDSLGNLQDTNFAQTMEEYFVQAEPGTKTAEDRQYVLNRLHLDVSTEYAAPLTKASVKELAPWMFDSWEMSYMGVSGGGYDRLIASLAAPHMEKIQLQSRVTDVKNYGGGQMAQVTYKDERTGATRTVAASAVLVTVPLGILKAGDLNFVPQLPPAKLSAINTIGYGTLNKCTLYWQNEANAATWWPQKTWIALTTAEDQTSGAWTSFFNPVAENGGARILTGFVAGEDADAMVNQSDAQILATIMANLRTILGTAVPEPTKFVVMRWNQDEFAKGSYSFPSSDAAGQDWVARQELGRSVGNLFFAGEATDAEEYATTAGAYESGVRAAAGIANMFR